MYGRVSGLHLKLRSPVTAGKIPPLMSQSRNASPMGAAQTPSREKEMERAC